MKILIVGIGKLGYQLASAFSQKGNDVIAMDKDPEALQRVEEHLDVLPMLNNGFEIDALKEAHIKELDLTISVTDDDETNILVAFLAKRLGSKKVIARVRNPEYDKQASYLKAEMQIDRIVNPDLATANEIARYLTGALPFHTEIFEASKVLVADVHAGNMPDIVGRLIMELGIPRNMLVVAIVRNGQVIIPHGKTQIEPSDTLYMIGTSDSIESFYKAHCQNRIGNVIKSVTILGGGRIGYYLAVNLLSKRMEVKIIESDKPRCQYLAERLGNALIIHGDGTDINLLEDEGIFNSDALVSLTGLDEENLLISLLAKQHGMDRVIAKASRSSYIPIIEKLGVEMAVNPAMITAAEIMRFTYEGNIRSLALLAGGKAELTELVIEEGAYILKDSLAELNLPKGIIVGCIMRADQVIIPDGSTRIKAGDRAVVFTVSSDQQMVTKYFHPVRR
ncbi:MAG TPA: Trk system potassium transporter TrkA [Bacillota bacterium]|nr:Trk system potassium transporter TrkA [Bacillota bacterium]HOA15224.1 Trk system potassium transporter TrkA [Bacillota bacterium]HOG52272.1 Trk system potassium transporter TrkA [Bacillota bacterium]